MRGKKITENEFIERCKKVNPQFKYKNIGFTKYHNGFVYPSCKKHGKFRFNTVGLSTKPIKCPECDREERFYDFVKKAKIIHNNKYEYDINSYKTNKIPMVIICPIHGEFKQAPGDHLKGWGCSKCSGKYKPTTEEWIMKASSVYNNYYDYSKVIYVDNKTPVTVICPKHGEFYPIPNNHLKGISGCPKCNDELKHKRYSKTTNQFIIDSKKIHGELYNYDNVDYYNKETPVIIICKKHGEFKQTPNAHLTGAGCPKCKNKNQTLLFEKLSNTFKQLHFDYEIGIKWLEGQRFDIYNKQYNFAVEYDGEQHYVPIEHFGGESYFQMIQKRDCLKNTKCISNKCKLFRIKFDYSEEDYQELVDNINNYINNKKFIPKLRKGSAITII